MAEQTKIQWCDATFNPWIGCTRVSPGCDNCYAAVSTPARAMGIEWGVNAKRHRTSASNWKQPIRWNEQAKASGTRPRVFCSSLADVFDNAVDPAWRSDLFKLIEATPNLDWLLLTKRIGNVKTLTGGVSAWPNVWLGATVVNQQEADRDIPKLLGTPAAVRFLSCEPLLGPINLQRIVLCSGESYVPGFHTMNLTLNALRGAKSISYPPLDWIIVGGESGSGARSMEIEWAESLRKQCGDFGTAFFMKQLGGVRDKRGSLEDFPPELRVREFPAQRAGKAVGDMFEGEST